MIERNHKHLSVVKQCALLSLSRSSYYHEPMGESARNLEIMAEIDRQFLATPFYGVQQMTWHLQAMGWAVNIKRVRRLMRLMGLMPIYQKPRTSIPAKDHKVYPYLLKGMRIERPNQVNLVFGSDLLDRLVASKRSQRHPRLELRRKSSSWRHLVFLR